MKSFFLGLEIMAISIGLFLMPVIFYATMVLLLIWTKDGRKRFTTIHTRVKNKVKDSIDRIVTDYDLYVKE